MSQDEIYYMIQSINSDTNLSEEIKTTRLAVYQALYYYVDGNSKQESSMSSIIRFGKELEQKTSYDFFLNKDFEKTRIMLKGYILNSRFITELNKKGIEKYTFKDIQTYLEQYIQSTGDTIDDVALAVKLYSLLKEYKYNIDNVYLKVKETLSEVFGEEMLTNSGDIRLKYQRVMERINRLMSRQMFDDRTVELLKSLLNQLFSYYLNGNLIIPIDMNESKERFV